MIIGPRGAGSLDHSRFTSAEEMQKTTEIFLAVVILS